MSELSVEVLKITKHPNEAAIKVRWRIKGIPSIRKVVPYVGRKIKVDADGYRYRISLSKLLSSVQTDRKIFSVFVHSIFSSRLGRGIFSCNSEVSLACVYLQQTLPMNLLNLLHLSNFLCTDIWMVFLYLKLEVMVLFTVTDFIRCVE